MKSFRKIYLAMIFVLLAICYVNAQENKFNESDLSKNGKTAYQTLLKVELFALGPIYSAGKVPEGELALEVLLKEKEAVPALKSLILIATPEGGLYGLFGLRRLKSESFDSYHKIFKDKKELPERGTKPFETPAGYVNRMDGCNGSVEKRLIVADKIKNGKFDGWIKFEEWINIKKEKMKNY